MTQLLVKSIADFSTTLTSKTAIGATTATLTSGIDADGVQLPTGVYGFTIDRNSTQKEHFTATLTGSALTDIKTVTRGTGVGTAGFIRTHRKGSEIVITDHVAIKRMMNVLDGTTSFDASTPLGYDGTATISTANQFATKDYVDSGILQGAADASTTVKGITKMSVAPVSASSPIAVGDNDGRVPTQSENDALVGTSGTPSSSNKYVTNDDTSVTPSASKVVRYDASGLLSASSIYTTSLAGETLAVGNPVAQSYYQTDGGVLYDAKTSVGSSLATGGGTVTLPITIAANSNRALVIFVAAYSLGSVSVPPAPLFGGAAMTAGNNNLSLTYDSTAHGSFYVLNPASGTTNITWALPASSGQGIIYSITAYSYYNVNTSAIDGSAYTVATSQSYTITNLASLVVTSCMGDAVPTGGSNNLNNQISVNTGGGKCQQLSGDGGQVVPIQANTFGATGGTWVYSISLKPATTASYGYVKKTSASTPTNIDQSNLYNSFMGFVSAITGGGTAGTTVTVAIGGIITGLTSLIPFTTYYLSNTSGTLSTTAGTNSKKVGVALSTTSLMIKQDN